MNLKNLGNNSAAIPVLLRWRRPLVAATIAASPTSTAVASAAGVAGIIGVRGRIGSAMIAPAKEMAPAVAASGIRASVRSSAAV